MDCPLDFRCPISMELMKDPVTISTGVTYERKYIEKWFFTYKKMTCPTTMQNIDDFEFTPNHTLKRLILAWQESHCTHFSSPKPSIKHDEFMSLLNSIDSSPFKVSLLKKLRSIIEISDEIKVDFKRSGGDKVLVNIILQLLVDFSDFSCFRACEEALSVLHLLPLIEDDETISLLSKPECIKSMAIMLQRGSSESRFYAISIFYNMAKVENYDWNFVIQDQGFDLFKAMLELVSDEMGTKASSLALQILIEILTNCKKSQLKAIEAGAMCTLIELLPDSNRPKSEKILQLIMLLCKCAEGRLALMDHGIGIGAISKKMLHVSSVATKIVVKIIWLICSLNPTDRVLEEMLVVGVVSKLEAFLHIDGGSSTKDKVVKMLKLHGHSWLRYPCFPSDLKEYLGLV